MPSFLPFSTLSTTVLWVVYVAECYISSLHQNQDMLIAFLCYWPYLAGLQCLCAAHLAVKWLTDHFMHGFQVGAVINWGTLNSLKYTNLSRHFFFSLAASVVWENDSWDCLTVSGLSLVGQSSARLGCSGSVTDFSQQDLCHADLFISLTVSLDYHRNELKRLHRGVYEAASAIHTVLRKLSKWKCLLNV